MTDASHRDAPHEVDRPLRRWPPQHGVWVLRLRYVLAKTASGAYYSRSYSNHMSRYAFSVLLLSVRGVNLAC